MVLDVLLWIPVVLGFIGAIGLLRMPNVYTRIFASTMCAVGCTCVLLFILILKNIASPLALKYLLLIFLIVLTSPTASHAIANAAYKNKVDLKGKKKKRVLE